MPQDPPASSPGGAIYEDGEPISEQILNGESITVPSAETWEAKIAAGLSGGPEEISINGSPVSQVGIGQSETDAAVQFNATLKGGDTVSIDSDSSSSGGAVNISGWSV